MTLRQAIFMAMAPRRHRSFFFPFLLVLILGGTVSLSADQSQYFYDELGRLTSVVDEQGNAAFYEYDAVGNLLSITRGPVTVPVITSRTPSATDLGTTPTLVLTGTGLWPATVTVSNTDILATVDIGTPTSLAILLTVPSATTLGPVTVTVSTPGGMATTTITIVDPLTTVMGTVVDIAGQPIQGATVAILNAVSGVTAPDGSFTLPGVATVSGPLQVKATGTIAGIQVMASSALFPPIPNGITNVGLIQLLPPSGLSAVVVNGDDFSLDVLDPLTLSIKASVVLPTSFRPREVAVTPDGSTALVTVGNTTGHARELIFVDLSASPPAVITKLSLPFTNVTNNVVIACARPEIALVTGFGGRDAISVDLASRTIISELEIPLSGISGKPQVLPPTGSLVLARGGSQLLLLSLDSLGALFDTGLGNPQFPFRSIVVSPTGHMGMLPTSEESLLDVVDIDGNGTVVFRERIEFVPSDPFFVPGPHSLTFTKDGTRAYVLIEAKDLGVLDIDASRNVTDSGIRVLNVGGGGLEPQAIAILENSQRVLVRKHDVVTVIDQSTHTIMGTIPVPGSGAIAPSGNFCP